MRIFLDNDVLLDVLTGRAPHFVASAAVLDWAEAHPGSAGIAWHTCANLHYLSKGGAAGFLRDLLVFVEIPHAGTDQMRRAVDWGFRDLEDAMQAAAAEFFGAQVIVSRNVKDYRRSPIKALTPAELLPSLR